MNTEREALEAKFAEYLKTVWMPTDDHELAKDIFSKGWQAALANKPEAEPVMYISLSSLNWALSGIANGIGQFSYVEDKTDGGCNIPLYTAPPSTAALQKRIEELEAHREDLRLKIDGEKSCACAYDSSRDICLVHSPAVMKLQAEVLELKAVISKKDEALQLIAKATRESLCNLPISGLKAGDVQAPKEGWKMVPIVTTKHQLTVAHQHFDDMAISIDAEQIDVIYKAMIAATPTDTEGK